MPLLRKTANLVKVGTVLVTLLASQAFGHKDGHDSSSVAASGIRAPYRSSYSPVFVDKAIPTNTATNVDALFRTLSL
jgi:hypothetical protein